MDDELWMMDERIFVIWVTYLANQVSYDTFFLRRRHLFAIFGHNH